MTRSARVVIYAGSAVLIAVLALAGLGVHLYMTAIQRSKEAVLRENLSRTRAAIARFHDKHGLCPPNLQALIDDGYLRSLPYDPIASSNSEWVSKYPVRHADTADLNCDFRSGAPGVSTEGTKYLTW